MSLSIIVILSCIETVDISHEYNYTFFEKVVFDIWHAMKFKNLIKCNEFRRLLICRRTYDFHPKSIKRTFSVKLCFWCQRIHKSAWIYLRGHYCFYIVTVMIQCWFIRALIENIFSAPSVCWGLELWNGFTVLCCCMFVFLSSLHTHLVVLLPFTSVVQQENWSEVTLACFTASYCRCDLYTAASRFNPLNISPCRIKFHFVY
jgi:hypothetical protein